MHANIHMHMHKHMQSNAESSNGTHPAPRQSLLEVPRYVVQYDRLVWSVLVVGFGRRGANGRQ